MLGIFPLVQLFVFKTRHFLILNEKNVVTLKSGSEVTQGH